MKAATFSRQRLVTFAAVAGAVLAFAPTAAGQTGFRGSPDAIDRAVAARQAERRSTALEARERGMIERPIVVRVGPDAFERALITHGGEATTNRFAMLDSRERSLATRPPGATVIASPSAGIDWSDFGIGAGAGIGFMLLSLGAGWLGIRRSNERVTTA